MLGGRAVDLKERQAQVQHVAPPDQRIVRIVGWVGGKGEEPHQRRPRKAPRRRSSPRWRLAPRAVCSNGSGPDVAVGALRSASTGEPIRRAPTHGRWAGALHRGLASSRARTYLVGRCARPMGTASCFGILGRLACGQPPSMKLIIQIPCWNEAQTLPLTLADLPRDRRGLRRGGVARNRRRLHR